MKKKFYLIFTLIFTNLLFAQNITEIKINNFPKEFENNLNFFTDGAGINSKTKLPVDNIKIEKDGFIIQSDYVNTTEIGFYLNILVEAEKSGTVGALERIDYVLQKLIEAPNWEGLFYWPIVVKNGKLINPENEIVPVVDNGNLAFSLAGVAGAYLNSKDSKKIEIVRKVEFILNRQKNGWSKLYDENKNLLWAGWDSKNNKSLGYYIDRKSNESRTGALWAILITKDMGEKKVPDSAFKNMELYTTEIEISNLFSTKKYTPMMTWDGGMFQAMMPAIWIDEKKLSPNYKIVEDILAVQLDYISKNKIPALLSSSATIEGGYSTFGIKEISESYAKFNNNINHDGMTGTPHASALAYMIDKKTSLKLLQNLKNKYPASENKFGFYDAINNQGEVTDKMISLDSGMFVCAFLSENIRKDVENYLKYNGSYEKLIELYKNFVPNN